MGSFNSWKPDMKLKQSIQRASKREGGIVGQTRNSAVVVEWERISHEILLIQTNFRELTNERVINHRETSMHHELRGNNGVIFYANVSSSFDCVHTAYPSKSLHYHSPWCQTAQLRYASCQ